MSSTPRPTMVRPAQTVAAGVIPGRTRTSAAANPAFLFLTMRALAALPRDPRLVMEIFLAWHLQGDQLERTFPGITELETDLDRDVETLLHRRLAIPCQIAALPGLRGWRRAIAIVAAIAKSSGSIMNDGHGEHPRTFTKLGIYGGKRRQLLTYLLARLDFVGHAKVSHQEIQQHGSNANFGVLVGMAVSTRATYTTPEPFPALDHCWAQYRRRSVWSYRLGTAAMVLLILGALALGAGAGWFVIAKPPASPESWFPTPEARAALASAWSAAVGMIAAFGVRLWSDTRK